MVWKTRAVQSETGSGQAVEPSKKIVPQSPAVVGTEERAASKRSALFLGQFHGDA